MDKHVAEGPHNAPFSTYTYDWVKVDGFKSVHWDTLMWMRHVSIMKLNVSHVHQGLCQVTCHFEVHS